MLAHSMPEMYVIYVDEAGFNLAKTRRQGRNVIAKRATADVPDQRGANITMCAAISSAGLVLQKIQIGPHNTERLLLFLDDLYQQLVPEAEREQVGGNMRTFVIAWGNVAFHHSHAITNWFTAHPRMVCLFLPPTHLSSTKLRIFFLPGGGKCMIIDHMTKCPSWIKRMPAAETSQLKTARGG